MATFSYCPTCEISQDPRFTHCFKCGAPMVTRQDPSHLDTLEILRDLKAAAADLLIVHTALEMGINTYKEQTCKTVDRWIGNLNQIKKMIQLLRERHTTGEPK